MSAAGRFVNSGGLEYTLLPKNHPCPKEEACAGAAGKVRKIPLASRDIRQSYALRKFFLHFPSYHVTLNTGNEFKSNSHSKAGWPFCHLGQTESAKNTDSVSSKFLLGGSLYTMESKM